MAIFLVGTYILWNLVIVAVGFYRIAANPAPLADWTNSLFTNCGGPRIRRARLRGDAKHPSVRTLPLIAFGCFCSRRLSQSAPMEGLSSPWKVLKRREK